MKEYLTVLKRDRDILQVRIDQEELFDQAVMEMAVHDPHCLSCRLVSRQPVVLEYRISDMNDLGQFLDSYVFTEREGYRFLVKMFEDVIVSGRGKPLLLTTDAVFCSRHGDQVRFAAVPLKTDAWLLQREAMKGFVCQVRTRFRTTTDYEIPGWLQMAEGSRDFSLPQVVQGLRDLERQYHPRRFPFFPEKPHPPFYTREEVIAPEITYELCSELPPVPERTQVLGGLPETGAQLKDGAQCYDLAFETTIIGRGLQADIRLEDESVSAAHARITRQDDRFYIQDLKSANGTFLDGKRVCRRRRLKDGMEVRFAKLTLRFCQ